MTDAADRTVLTAPPPAPVARRADDTASSSLNMTLHPLVVINISDHFTRARAQSGGRPGARVFGALLGEQIGRHVEIANSFEMKITVTAGGETRADPDYLRTRLEQYKKTFPKYDMLGWYSTGTEVEPGDLAMHQALCEVTESLLYMLLNPAQALTPGNRDLPILIHESEVHVVDEQPTMRFVSVGYKIDSVESERIAVDHVAHILPSGDSNSGSALTQHLGTQHTAITMLTERIDIIRNYLQAVADGTVAADHEVLREVKSLCAKLPAIDTPRYHDEFMQDYNNTLLVSYLGCITKGMGSINELIDKYNSAFDRGHSRRRGIF
mmetsp:Transcript_21437/g.43834  ORF Transcript_21437/g.43834 Transcript_21437/m.43834 type:complete len:324 (+) Transcript_21437:42-1013(+)